MKILSRPLYVFLYGISFAIFKISAYPASLSVLTLINFLFLYVVGAYILFKGFKEIMHHDLAGFAVMLLLCSLFHVMGVAQLFGYSYAYVPVSFYVKFYISVIVLIFFLSRIKKYALTNNFGKLNPILNVFLLFTILIFIVNGIKKNNDSIVETKEHFHSQVKRSNVSNSKDIVWILLDEYASSGSLKQQFSFVNPLDSQLEKKGFVILKDMHSLYANTLFSVNSIFNMDDSIVPSSYYEGVELLRHGSLIPTLEKSGYQFTNLGFFDLAEHPMLENRSGYPYSFLQQLLSGTIFNTVYTNMKFSKKSSDDYNHRVYLKLNETLDLKLNTPRFIWAHLAIPHEPFCRDENGLYRDEALFKDNISDTTQYKKLYVNYLQYANRLIISLINKHPDIANKIIVITGDHGPRYPFLTNKSLQKWPYAAIHFPDTYDTVGLQKLNTIAEIPSFLLDHISKK